MNYSYVMGVNNIDELKKENLRFKRLMMIMALFFQMIK